MGDIDVKKFENAIEFLGEEKYGEEQIFVYLALDLLHPPYGV